jgi:hypothetical protein
MYTISTNHIRDKVAFVEGGEKLVLTVDVDPFGIIGELTGVIDDLKKLNDNSSPEEIMRLCRELGVKMFGEVQTQKLFEFYGGNEKQLFSVLTRYFIERLNKKIVEAQKKIGRKKLFGR